MVGIPDVVSPDASDQSPSPPTPCCTTSKVSLPILADVTTAQSTHGLKHTDYERYRRYCSRRLARLRRSTKTTNRTTTVATTTTTATGATTTTHIPKLTVTTITPEIAAENVRTLLIPLSLAERDWAFAMDIKRTQPAGPHRARRRVLSRLARASQHAATLAALTRSVADEATMLDAEAYAQNMRATLALEREEWPAALAAYQLAHKVYTGLAGMHAGTPAAALFERRMDDVSQALRFCRYNISRNPDAAAAVAAASTDADDAVGANGDEDAAALLQTLRSSDSTRSADGISDKIEAALSEARRRAAESFGHVTWCGAHVPLRSERVREAVLTAEDESREFDERNKKKTRSVDEYDKLFVVLNDAVKVVTDERDQFRASATDSDERVRELELLVAYLSHSRLRHTVARNELLVTSLRTRKGAKPEDFVRLYDTLIGNMTDILGLRGVEEDAGVVNEAEGRRRLFRAHRCFHLAQCYQAAGLQNEAAGLFDRVAEHAASLTGVFAGEARELVGQSVGMKCRARAEALLEELSLVNGVSGMAISNGVPMGGVSTGRKMLMVDHLDELMPFAKPAEGGAGNVAICDMPPALEAVPCKPVLFDLAIDGVRLPGDGDGGIVEGKVDGETREGTENNEGGKDERQVKAESSAKASEEEKEVKPSTGFGIASTRLGRWWSGRS